MAQPESENKVILFEVGSFMIELNATNATGTGPVVLTLRVAAGTLTLNGNATVHGFVEIPTGTVTINGNATLNGGVSSDRLIINGNGRLNTDQL